MDSAAVPELDEAKREVAPVSANGYPFQMVGGVPIITAPAEIDTTTVSELRAILTAWQSRGDHTRSLRNQPF